MATCYSPLSLGCPRLPHADAQVPADGLIKPEENPSFCDLEHARRRGHQMLLFSTKQRATEGATAFDDID